MKARNIYFSVTHIFARVLLQFLSLVLFIWFYIEIILNSVQQAEILNLQARNVVYIQYVTSLIFFLNSLSSYSSPAWEYFLKE